MREEERSGKEEITFMSMISLNRSRHIAQWSFLLRQAIDQRDQGGAAI